MNINISSFYFDEDLLGRQLGVPLSPKSRDLLRIAMHVYAADRLTKWNRFIDADGPSRQMPVLTVPVSDPDFWTTTEVSSLLRRSVEFVTGDTWEFRFTIHRSLTQGQWWSTRDRNNEIVCLDSGGLDSVAGLANRLLEWNGSIFAVTARHQSGQRRVVRDIQLPLLRERFGNRISSIMVSTRLKNPPPMKHQELTQRSRSFLFAALGGVAAIELGVNTVEVYENGVGAINLPPMTGMMFGGRATKSAHPEFFRRMGALLTATSGERIEFVLPFRYKTKAELVKRIANDELLVRVAQESVSCVHYPSRVKGMQKQCGVCPGCIGRRQALIIGGILESPATYLFDVFGRGQDVAGIPTSQLAHLKSIISQVELLGCLPEARLLPLAVKVHLAGVLGRDEDHQPAIQLLQRYRNEWRSLIEAGLQADRPWAQWHGPISSLSPGSVV
jgi:hypothetical protein